MRITRRVEFDAGHRLQRHESKCANVHGHRYVADVVVAAQSLDAVGRVVDFSVVKDLVGGWVDENWDHGFIAERGDPILAWLAEHHQKLYALPHPPSAEHMSRHLHQRADEILRPRGLTVTNVRLYETPNCWADSE